MKPIKWRWNRDNIFFIIVLSFEVLMKVFLDTIGFIYKYKINKHLVHSYSIIFMVSKVWSAHILFWILVICPVQIVACIVCTVHWAQLFCSHRLVITLSLLRVPERMESKDEDEVQGQLPDDNLHGHLQDDIIKEALSSGLDLREYSKKVILRTSDFLHSD